MGRPSGMAATAKLSKKKCEKYIYCSSEAIIFFSFREADTKVKVLALDYLEHVISIITIIIIITTDKTSTDSPFLT